MKRSKFIFLLILIGATALGAAIGTGAAHAWTNFYERNK
jgi:hypothetical protein